MLSLFCWLQQQDTCSSRKAQGWVAAMWKVQNKACVTCHNHPFLLLTPVPHLRDRGSSVEGMCFLQCQGLTLHTALCSFPWECKLWHTMKELEVSQSPHPQGWGSLGSWIVPGILWQEADGLPVSSGVFAPCFVGEEMIRRINSIDPAQFSKDAQVTLKCCPSSRKPSLPPARALHGCSLALSEPLFSLSTAHAAGCLETPSHPSSGSLSALHGSKQSNSSN